MKAHSSGFIAAAFFVLCIASPSPLAAQFSKTWTKEQIVGEYTCRWTRDIERLNEQLGAETGVAIESELDLYGWPKHLILSSDGTWRANNETGEFAVQDPDDNELKIKSATWAKYPRSKLVADHKGAVGIAVYLPSWCGNDAFVHLKKICERKGEAFNSDERLELSLPNLYRIPNYLASFQF